MYFQFYHRVAKLFCEIKRSISTNWIHGFGNAALKAIEAEYGLRGLNTLEEKSRFVMQMLGKKDQRDKERPFLWQSTDDVLSGNNNLPINQASFFFCLVNRPNDGSQGLFLGRLVAKTLALHVELTASQNGAVQPDKKPRGALMMAILAVCLPLAPRITLM